jgi:hypothetical protein
VLSEALPAERRHSPLLGLAAPPSPPLLGCRSPPPAIKLQRRASPPPSSDTAALRVGAEHHRFFLGIAGARAARVAAGPPCCRAKTPPFSTGEHPLSTLSPACPRHRTRTSTSAPPCLPVADVANCRPLPNAASEPSHLRPHAASGPSSPHTPGFAPSSFMQP